MFAAKIADKALNCKITLYAADTTLFLLVSAVPFVVLFMSMVQFILPYSEYELTKALEMVMPGAFSDIAGMFVNQIYVTPQMSVVSVTVVTVLWAASKGFTSLAKGIDGIYSGAEARGYFIQRIFGFIYTFVFIVSMVLMLLVIVLGGRIAEFISERMGQANVFISVVRNFRTVIFFVLLAFVFALGYRILPGRKVKFIKQCPGAVSASAVCIAFSYVYRYYVDNFSNYSAVYGSIGAAVLFVLWLYFCINIFMLGGVVNVVMIKL